GLLLTTRRFEEAKSVFRYYAKYQKEDGLIPNRIFPDGKALYNTADGSLWFVEAVYRYYQATEDINFVKEMLPVVNKIIGCYTAKSGDIYMDKDNLVVVPAQWTWMDAAPNGKDPVTPRNGKPIEIQSLFYNALGIASEFNRLAKNEVVAGFSLPQLSELKKKVKIAINEKFFNVAAGLPYRNYPFDVLDGDQHKDAVRPNAVFLLSLSKVNDLLPEDKKRTIIDTVEKELLTPFGLRTLSPNDPKYIGKYDTFAPQEVKDQAYHQGTVWPYLISHYIFAKIELMKNRPYEEVVSEIKNSINNLIYIIREKGTIPEVFSGNIPYIAGGTVSQAWSVAAMLDIFDLLNLEFRRVPLIDTKELEVISIQEIKRLLGAG
ncbi:MAG: amylo-alpha-1,6-glucosidase, partial [Elusimicrobiota bacterium]|nr:amylo-alpha-1,6-glucosidase [Elusimicrobiota bacterium]